MNGEELRKLCKGYTLNLKHPAIKENHEYQIMGFRERDGEYGPFFILYCFIPELKLYQRVFSNSKLSHEILSIMPFWTRYDKDYDEMYVWQGKNEIMKFYPGKLSNYNGNEYRKIVFDFEKL